MDIPPRLEINDCPLLKKDPQRLQPILDRFNEAVGILNKFRTLYPRFLEQPDVVQRLKQLCGEAERLRRPHYLVGFLGTTGAGKSATLNNVLQAAENDAPAKPGPGEATTSVITRLRAIPSGQHGLRLRYLDTEEYLERRDTLCGWLGLPNTKGKTEQAILDELSQGLPAPTDNSRPRKPEDAPYLRDLLESYKAHGSLVKADSYEVPDPPYANRAEILNHAVSKDKSPAAATKYKLLNNAEITYRTSEIPLDLEMVDCPGFGATKSVDTLVTLNFIPKLDGALLVLRADLIYSTDLVDILESLKKAFKGKLVARVWVVVNKFDVPMREAKFDGRTVFDLIADLEHKHQIPLTQICLTSRKIYQEYVRNKGSISPERAKDLINLRPDDPVPPRCAAYPALESAFHELLKDGGISNLRNLIQNVMAPSVAAEICTAAAAQLQEIVTDLNFAFGQASHPINQQEQLDCIRWRNAVRDVIVSLEVRNPWIETKGKDLKEMLEKLFKENLHLSTLSRMAPQELVGEHDIHARILLTPALTTAMERTVQEVYQYVTDQFEQQNPPLPLVDLPNGRKPLEEWTSYRLEDRQNTSWRNQSMPRLHQRELLSRLVDPRYSTTFNATAYRDLMLEKIRVSSHQVIHAVRGQIRKRLRSLQHQLNRKIWRPENDAPATATLNPVTAP